MDRAALYAEIHALGVRLGAERVVLYGSRARGDNRERSDVDIAVFGLAEQKQAAFLREIDELPTLLEFDVVFASEGTSPELLVNINRDGVVL